jgi:hypothetical protein
MKLVRNISLVFVLFILASAAIAQQQCSLKLMDSTPHSGQYTATIYVIYNGAWESTLSNVNVTLNATTDIPFTLRNDVDVDLYRLVVYINEPVTGAQGPYYSLLFSTDYWEINNINVTANL